MRKRVNTKPSGPAVLRLMDALVDFIEAAGPLDSDAEDARQAVLAAADKAGYNHKK